MRKLRFMHTRSFILSLFLLSIAALANAQAGLQFDFTSPLLKQETSLFQVGLAPNIENTSVTPQYVKENPTGYSYLCRLELDIEKKSPIPVWFKLGENNGLWGNAGGNAAVRVKLFRF